MGGAKVVTLCGSSRFEAHFGEVDERLTREGWVVLGPDWAADVSVSKEELDEAHRQKIRLADEVFVVDPGGYVGASTRREIAFAQSLDTPVRYLSREA